MDNGEIVSESIEYTRAALVGKWTNWLIFIICTLPIALIQFVADPKKIVTGGTIHWELIPWPQIIVLCIAEILLMFIISGYLVRIYKGTTPPPAFDSWGSLFVDGIKLTIVNILWFIPAIVIFVIAFALFLLGTRAGTGSINPMVNAGLLVALIGLIILVITIIYASLANVRFARTGSIREGIRFSAITGTIQAIGWGTYIIALVIFVVLVLLFSLVISVLALIPFVGWVIQLVLNPLISVFSARYFSRVYDHSIPQVPAPASAPVG
jgi:uncharacterized membrane protein (DUF485 family)